MAADTPVVPEDAGRVERIEVGGGVYWRRYNSELRPPLFELMMPDGSFVDANISTEEEARAFAQALASAPAGGGAAITSAMRDAGYKAFGATCYQGLGEPQKGWAEHAIAIYEAMERARVAAAPQPQAAPEGDDSYGSFANQIDARPLAAAQGAEVDLAGVEALVAAHRTAVEDFRDWGPKGSMRADVEARYEAARRAADEAGCAILDAIRILLAPPADVADLIDVYGAEMFDAGVVDAREPDHKAATARTALDTAIASKDLKIACAEAMIKVQAGRLDEAGAHLQDAREELAAFSQGAGAGVTDAGRLIDTDTPRKGQILAWCDHDADTYFEGGKPDARARLTTYAAHADGMSRAPTGFHILEWGGAYNENTHEFDGGSMPDWWFVAGSDFEVAANPILWWPLPERNSAASNHNAGALASRIRLRIEATAEQGGDSITINHSLAREVVRALDPNRCARIEVVSRPVTGGDGWEG